MSDILSLPEGGRVDLLAAGGTALGVEQVLHAAFPVEDVWAGQSDDVGVGLDVHEARHAAALEWTYMFSPNSSFLE